MFDTIYVEKEIRDHPVTGCIIRRFPGAHLVDCEHYGEIFNRKGQNFRLQKRNPGLILAKKHNRFVLPSPPEYGIGGRHNYYFSHMLNCLYDCRYCFLQGMFQSAHYVLFVNYEDFNDAIQETVRRHPGESVHFFSGYDCDSLALEPVTGFLQSILPVFEAQPDALLELRTKSTQIRSLLKRSPLENCVAAFSFTPEPVAAALEHKTPSVSRRLEAMRELQQHGWKIGLRFDPLIYHEDFETSYTALFSFLFEQLDLGRIHSVSLGNFRLPRDYFRKMSRHYPHERLFASPLENDNGLVSYPARIRTRLLEFCTQRILTYIPPERFFPCDKIC